MDIFIAICHDRHIDDVVRVFSTPVGAIQCCKDFMEDEYDIKEHELTSSMIRSGWLYYATYGCEGDGTRVERGWLDPEE